MVWQNTVEEIKSAFANAILGPGLRNDRRVHLKRRWDSVVPPKSSGPKPKASRGDGGERTRTRYDYPKPPSPGPPPPDRMEPPGAAAPSHTTKLPEPINNSGGGSRPNMGDVDMKGAAAVAPAPLQGGQPTAGIGSTTTLGVHDNTHRSTMGARCHRSISNFDRHKAKGRKRARSGIELLFEAQEQWVPSRVLTLINTQEGVSDVAVYLPNDDGQQLLRIARSRSTFAAIIGSQGFGPPTGYECLGLDYYRNGLFASYPQVPGAAMNPGVRITPQPHIGKLTLCGTVEWAFTDNYGAESTAAFFPPSCSAQLHLVRFANKYAALAPDPTPTNFTTAMHNHFIGKLDAADFDLGVGNWSYVSKFPAEMEGLGATIRKHNLLVTQEEELYPPRDHYKIHWSSPVQTCYRQGGGNLDGNYAPVNVQRTYFGPFRMDVTNVEIDIDKVINFNVSAAATAQLASEGTNQGDPYDCFHLILVVSPVVSGPGVNQRTAAAPHGPLDLNVQPWMGHSFSYVYNFSENLA